MLAARLLACRTRLLLDREPPAWREAASCLVEAESYLIGRRLHDLEAEVRELRRRLRDAASGSWPRALPSEPPGDRGTHLELASALRGIREDLSRALAADVGPEKAGDLLRGLDAFAERLREAQRRIEGRDARSPPPVRTPAIAGRSPAIRKLVDLIRQVALTSLPVLISGETGTGKELVARAVHGESPRHPAPFIAVSCAAVPEELLEAELFGYARGAFTGADADHEGLLRAASGGTVLFDGVSETPPAVQAKLLRVLDSGRVRPVGGSEEVEIDVRYLFTTSRDLRALAEEGSFRRDLFFRVSAFHLDVPPLRERLEDLAELVAHFRALAASPAEAPVFTEGALRALASHAWPGNVRELENLVTRLVLTRSDRIEAGDIEKALGAVSGEGLFSPALLRARSLKELRTLIEKEYLVQFVADRGGDVKQAAAALGVSVFALYKRLRGLGVPRGGG
jgi:DNA-binding NtrC family response regulator